MKSGANVSDSEIQTETQPEDYLDKSQPRSDGKFRGRENGGYQINFRLK